ncbi:hypothetical protein ACFE04_001649 [Oxalis oulophora]
MEEKEGFDDKGAVNDSPTDSFYDEKRSFLIAWGLLKYVRGGVVYSYSHHRLDFIFPVLSRSNLLSLLLHKAPNFLKDFSKELYIQHEATLWENSPKFNRSIASGGAQNTHSLLSEIQATIKGLEVVLVEYWAKTSKLEVYSYMHVTRAQRNSSETI